MARNKGFHLMTPEERKAIARAGGAAVPAEKRTFFRDRDLAKSAGAKGGAAPHKPRWPKTRTNEVLPPPSTETET